SRRCRRLLSAFHRRASLRCSRIAVVQSIATSRSCQSAPGRNYMKAITVREHGGMDKLQLEPDFPDPRPGAGDVVVRVRASSLNYHDIFTRRGMPGIKLQMPLIMGLDVAGEILEVGPDVRDWRVGDRVVVDPINRVEGGLVGETIHGGLAERCRVRAHQLV